jgi:hypothetical protein
MGGGRTRGCWRWKRCSIWSERAPVKLTITIYQDEDGVFIAECPSTPGCVSQGSSEAEAELNVMDVIVPRSSGGDRVTPDCCDA